ncbi:peptidoglycan-associated lipoprotein Pal [Phaeovibrio sulfidiphilus]|uniref:Peptidoglycan-associated lipoprotein n=1 Tax=Phaeovibrio sulfidiphilus TaxID=1220600 RepID=A0A8J6YGZ6_9PROT|nr:peptidoglycan-associated lipoprotein Pal [Phaeovibrio sulfidiphilus]MBE1236111.1 peptidoglycan-associated lipoprotein Pal [Phaeovibrio sulfidiphilus]
MKKIAFVAVASALLLSACSSTGASGSSSGSDGRGLAAPGSVQEFQQVAGDTVLFGYDQSNLDETARATLQAQARWLTQYSQYGTVVEGHADERGTREYNLALGERRANAVRDYLIGQGIASNRIRVISYGKERPVCVEATESCYHLNRRGVTVPQ